MSSYFRVFGTGPIGFAVTGISWYLAFLIEKISGVPPIEITPLLKDILVIFFVIDIVYMIGGSLLVLMPLKRGLSVVEKGPYRFVRHPIYAAILYSGTGLMAIYTSSWFLILSVIPLSIFWSWLVQKEEAFMLEKFGDVYENYMKNTGQFFPKISTENRPGSKENNG